MAEYVVSDLHFQHVPILRFDNRPFKTVDEMDRQLVRNWNRVVSKEDTVYILGDMFFRISLEKAEEILQQLNGKKIYIFGNHERLLLSDKRLIDTYFESTHHYLELPYEYDNKKHTIVMSHYPIPLFNGHFGSNATHFYGHVHATNEQVLTGYHQFLNFANSGEENTHKMINVGVMMSYMEYEPKPISYLLRKAEDKSRLMCEYYKENGLVTLAEFSEQRKLYL